jgi:hypothetical protein
VRHTIGLKRDAAYRQPLPIKIVLRGGILQ